MIIKHFAKHIKNFVKYLLFQGEIFHRKSLVTLTRRNTVCRPLFNRYLITATPPPPLLFLLIAHAHRTVLLLHTDVTRNLVPKYKKLVYTGDCRKIAFSAFVMDSVKHLYYNIANAVV